MKTEAASIMETRYLGVDLHRHYLVIGGVNTRQEENQTYTGKPRKLDVP